MDKVSNQISRRDFLKLSTTLIGTIAARPLTKGLENIVEEEAKNVELEEVRDFLVRSEDIPPGVVEVPNANEKFMFVDEVLQSALDMYQAWAKRDSRPAAYFNKPENFLSISNPNIVRNLMAEKVKPFIADLWSSVKNNQPIEGPDINSLTDLKNAVIDTVDGTGFKPNKFSQMDIRGVDKLLDLDPGSPLLARMKARTGEGATREQLIDAMHNEIDYIWEWVDKEKTASPMKSDKLLACLIYINKGDVRGSLWDLAIITKLAARNNHDTFDFNEVKKEDGTVDLATIRRENSTFLGRVQDTFSVRVSANWNLQNIDNPDLFAHKPKKFAPKNLKPFDVYSSAGALYHGTNIMALAGTMDYRFIQLVLFLKYAAPSEKIGFNEDQGLEKIAADMMTASRLDKVQDILFRLPQKQL
jgi:hypothetical protein